jgi:UDP-N-acetylglucosamine 4,6-dehydratase
MKNIFDGKTIFITGGTGSWGTELVTQLLEKYNPKQIKIYSRGEHKQVDMARKFNNKKLKFIIGDVRDRNILTLAMQGSDYVFHLAALKHVPVCEENTWEAVLTNVYGTQNVIEAAMQNKVKKVIDVSTDKAVDPFNLYGVTKACGERLIANANINYQTSTKFVCIRGGNVLGTNGSVLPLFKKQLSESNTITVTDPAMTRYLMSTKEAIGLVFEAVTNAVGGEIFVMRMNSSTVEDMADVMIELFGDKKSKKKNIGVRPGEKMDEVLVSKNESVYTKVFSDKYFVILPSTMNESLKKFYKKYPKAKFTEFTSNNAVRFTKSSLIQVLKKESWLWTKS